MDQIQPVLQRLGLVADLAAVKIGGIDQIGSGPLLTSRSPIHGTILATLSAASITDLPEVLIAASDAFRVWRIVPAPQRGEFVRRLGNRFREFKSDLATIISYEAGKITQEALGEVQEVIDICDFAVGLSRQLHGLTIASERPLHRLAEQWHPLGPVGVITAFNFPMAVWAWNAALAWVCGNPVVWKPSEKTPLCALACQSIVAFILREMPEIPHAISSVVIGLRDVGEALADSPALPLISATGSTKMGRDVAQRVAARLGRSLLELGGNNGMIVTPSASLDMDDKQRTGINEILSTYEEQLDRDLTARNKVYEEVGGKIGELMRNQDMDAAQKLLDQAREAGLKVREVNKKFARQVEDALPADQKAAMAAAVKKAAHPDVYRDSQVSRQIEAAVKLSDLDETQKKAIEELKGRTTREIGSVNDKMATAAEEVELTISVKDIMGRFRGGPGAGDDLRQQRRDLESAAAESLKKILKPEQMDQLPKPERRDQGGGRGGRRGQPQDGASDEET